MNFAIVYGRGDNNVAADLNVSLAQAKEFKEKYFAGFPKLKKLIEDTINSTRAKGYSETMTGRRRYLPDINLKGMSKSIIGKIKAAERQAFNAVIQGSAADLMRQAMPIAERLVLKFGGELVLQVHDELVFYIPEDRVEEFSKAIKVAMELDNICGIKIDVPIEVDVGTGDNYYEAK
jgi:DNA polymerase-1